MKRTNKRGFTIVELVIVIAVIAILAAVLIPTFSSIVEKANLSADKQLVAQMNKILAAEAVFAEGDLSEDDAKKLLEDNGITDFELKSSGCVLKYGKGQYYIYQDNECIYPEGTPNDDNGDNGDEQVQQYGYTVKYYQQNIENDDYTEVTGDKVTGTAALGTTVSGKGKTYPGFTLNDQKTQNPTISADETQNVIEFYYDRVACTVTLTGENIDKFEGDGTYRYGTEVTITAEAKAHYEFTGWTGGTVENNKITVTGDITLTATAKAKEYGITYNWNGGTEVANAQTSYTFENKDIKLPTPQRDNTDINITRKTDAPDAIQTAISYEFVGWKIGETIHKAESTYTVSNVGDTISAEAIWVRKVVYTCDGYESITVYFADDVGSVSVYGVAGMGSTHQAQYQYALIATIGHYYCETTNNNTKNSDTDMPGYWDFNSQKKRVVCVASSETERDTLLTYIAKISS